MYKICLHKSAEISDNCHNLAATRQRLGDLINHPFSAHDTVEECSDGVAMAQVMTNLKVHVLCCSVNQSVKEAFDFGPQPTS